MYCGDETGSFVGEIGSSTSRFGYGGEDCPKSDVPSWMYSSDGRIPTAFPTFRKGGASSYHSLPMNVNDTEDEIVPVFHPFPPLTSHLDSTSSFSCCDPDTFLENDGIIQSFEAWENVWSHALDTHYVWDRQKHFQGGEGEGTRRRRVMRSGKSCSSNHATSARSSFVETNLKLNASSRLIHPLLAIDSGYSVLGLDTEQQEGTRMSQNSSSHYQNSMTKKQKTTMMEILFESFSAPAIFIAPSPMLSSFANGRQTSLVLDIGASGMRVTPVVDGFLLHAAQRRSGRGGEWLSSVQYHALQEYFYLDDMETAAMMDTTKTLSKAEYDVYIPYTKFICPRYYSNHRHPLLQHQSIQSSIFYQYALRELMYEMKTHTHIFPLMATTLVDSSSPSSSSSSSRRIPFLTFHEKTSFTTIETTRAHTTPSTSPENKRRRTIHDPNDSYTISSGKVYPASSTDSDSHLNKENYSTKLTSHLEDDPNHSYVLPDGTRIHWNRSFRPSHPDSHLAPSTSYYEYGQDFCRLPELFFASSLPFFKSKNRVHPKEGSSSASSFFLQQTLSSLPLQDLIQSSLSAVADADVRKELCGNIILTGASSLFPNMEQRLSMELSRILPGMYRSKVLASQNTIERKFSSWIGGSILSSLGSFQQLWLGHKEYEEYGGVLALQRFP